MLPDQLLGRLWPKRLRYRIALAMVFALAFTHAVDFLLYNFHAERQHYLLTAGRLGKPMAAAVQAAETAAEQGTDVTAALTTLSSRNLAIRWYAAGEPPVPAGWYRQEVENPFFRLMVVGMYESFPPKFRPNDSPEAILSALSEDLTAENHRAVLWVALHHGGWIEFASPPYWHNHGTPFQLMLVNFVAAGLSAWLLLWLSGRLAGAIEQLKEKVEQPTDVVAPRPLSIQGPIEVIATAEAINKTRVALAEQVEGRTRLLAAISHDLRTPATRLRLRVEYVDDEILRAKILKDVDELSNMITSALEFFSEDVIRETTEVISFASLLQSLCDDYSDMGRPVTYQEAPPLHFDTVRTVFGGKERQDSFKQQRQLLLAGRPASLRRAFANLIDNALKYGECASVSVEADSTEIIVEIVDEGPGIPEDELQNVFKPFYRLDASRNRQTGGVGLGLSVVKSIIDAHQGRIELINRLRGGLRARVTLPRMM